MLRGNPLQISRAGATHIDKKESCDLHLVQGFPDVVDTRCVMTRDAKWPLVFPMGLTPE
jgi:hypothetical protein